MRINLTITKQFFLFLVLVSLVPVLVLSWLFYLDIDSKFNDRINSLLVLGTLVAEDTYHNDLQTLEISTRQAASFSLSQAYRAYLDTKNVTVLQAPIRRFQRIRHLDILTLFDKDKKQLITTNKAVELPVSMALLEKAFHGETVSGIERVYNPVEKTYQLVYLSASPIQNPDEQNGKAEGVLLTGYAMGQHFSLKNVLLIFPQLDVRILVKTPSGLVLRSTSNPKLTAIDETPLKNESKHQYIQGKSTSSFFQEEFSGETYRSLAFPFINTGGAPIGYIVVSTSENDFLQLKHKNILYVAGFLLLVGLLIIFASQTFNRTFIKPIDELANLSNTVAQGDLSARSSEDQQIEKVRDLMRNFNKMLSQLQEDNQLRVTFVSTLTHDLRTPLFAQRRVLEALEKIKKQYDPQLIEMIDAIGKGNTQLIDMVNKILEAYQYESGRIRIFPEAIDLHELVAECFNALAPLAKQKSIDLQNDVPPGFMIDIDAEQMQRVFQNLVGNGIANIQSQKTVIVTARGEGASNQIQVMDNGPGISKDIQQHLFQRYFTGHAKQKIGTGLGLFICRMIIELHQGSITVESEIGKGTTFTITLPQREKDDENG